MARAKRDITERSAFEVIEDAFHLVRSAPLSVPARHLIGTLPFVTGLVYFWMQMRNTTGAESKLTLLALGLTGLFVWMKVWQALYTRQLWRHLHESSETPSRLSLPGILFRQTIIQSTGLLILPFALLITVPLGYTYAFYQNATVLEDGQTRLSALVRKAWNHTIPWARQNHLIAWSISPFFLIMGMALYLGGIPFLAERAPDYVQGFIWFFGVVYLIVFIPLAPFAITVFVNVLTFLFLLLEVVRMLSGVDSLLMMNAGLLANETFLVAVCGLSYCLLDPLVKATYLVRCYHLMSVRTGEDLRLMIRRFGRTAMLTAIMAAGLWISSGTAFAAEPEKPAPPANTAPVMLQPERLPERLAPASPSVQPAEMDKALEQTLKKSRYAWRIPREQRIQEGKVLSFIRLCAVYVRETVEKVAKVIGKIFDFLFGRSDRNGATPKVADSAGTLRLLLIVASVLVVCVLLLLIYRKMAGEPPITDVEAVHISPARPDLNDENTSPDALSDDGWMALAQQLAEEGELRLALRALFLAGLAILAGRRMILVAKHKSNLDYLRELRSRNHETPTLPDLFKVNTLSFESVWYGDHPGSTEMLERMRENVERLRDHV